MVFLFIEKVSSFLKARSTFVFISLLIILLIYAVGGGIIFYLLEHEESAKSAQESQKSIVICMARKLGTGGTKIQKSRKMFQSCYQKCSLPQPWSWIGGMVFAYAAITTIGYGALSLLSNSGKIFYIFYCLFGMPLGLVFVANLGKYIEEFVGILFEKMKLCCKKGKQTKVQPEIGLDVDDDDDDDEEFEMGGLLFLFLFLFYIGIGVLGICLLLAKDIVDGVYINFNALTAIDANDFFNIRGFLLPISLAYITGGLALATVAIGVLGNYLRKLHSWGKKLKNSGKTKIWFGGQKLTVNNLIKKVGEQWGIDEEEIKNTDLDKLIVEKLDELNTEEGAKAAQERKRLQKLARARKKSAELAALQSETESPTSNDLGWRSNKAFQLRIAQHGNKEGEDSPRNKSQKKERPPLARTVSFALDDPKLEETINDGKTEDKKEVSADTHKTEKESKPIEVEKKEVQKDAEKEDMPQPTGDVEKEHQLRPTEKEEEKVISEPTFEESEYEAYLLQKKEEMDAEEQSDC